MKALYFDCSMGAAGDMLTAALLELYPEKEKFLAEMNRVFDGKAVVSAAADTKCGVTGTHVTMTVDGEEESEGAQYHDHHRHTDIGEIMRFIESVPLPEKVRHDAAEVYKIIAEAESSVHGCAVENVHFHEVGSIDAMADVLNVCMLMHLLAPEKVYASSINVGGGTVKCAHGVLPVPAPATASLLKGVPVYAGDIAGEMCTPTGAALIKYFATEFGNMPELTVERIGYGMGSRDFGTANCLRAFVGESPEAGRAVSELRCNLDDVTAEELAYAQELLLSRGALDVYTQALGMKKSRAGVMLTCLCAREREREFAELMLRHTPGLGVRVYHPERITLPRRETTVETEYGPVRVKYAGGKCKAEYEDLARIARETDKPLAEVRSEVMRKL